MEKGVQGKDTLLLLIITLLGEVNPGYAKYLKKNYFVTKEKDAANADPFLAGLWAARWVTVSEVPETAVEPEKMKDITEPSGVFVARPLYGEAMYIHPTFRMGIMSNHMSQTLFCNKKKGRCPKKS